MALALYLYIRSTHVICGRYLNTHRYHRAERAPSTARGCGAGEPIRGRYRAASGSITSPFRNSIVTITTPYRYAFITTTTGFTAFFAVLPFFPEPTGRPRLSVPAARFAASSANRSWRSLFILTGRPRLIVPPP